MRRPAEDRVERPRFDVRFEWGVQGLRHLLPSSHVVVVVDVLCFTTTVDVALARGASIYPYSSESGRGRARLTGPAAARRSAREPPALRFARRLGAQLAVGRTAMSARRPYSLSPLSMRRAGPHQRIVLPSPNGARLCLLAARRGVRVLAGCLRNARAVAAAAAQLGSRISVIAAGERWTGRPARLRVAVEDLIGAGAIIAQLPAASRSPEAQAAVAAFEAAAPALRRALLNCRSGRELAIRGFRGDVLTAARRDVSSCAPILIDGAFADYRAGIAAPADPARAVGRQANAF